MILPHLNVEMKLGYLNSDESLWLSFCAGGDIMKFFHGVLLLKFLTVNAQGMFVSIVRLAHSYES